MRLLVIGSVFLLSSAAACSSGDTTGHMAGGEAPADHGASGGHSSDGGSSGTSTTGPTTTTVPAITYDALFVVNGGNNTISVVDTERNEVAATIALSGARYPHHLSLSADRSQLALAVPGMDLSGGHGGHGAGHTMPGLVMLLDARTGSLLRARELPAMNHNAAFSPDGLEIWTTQMAEAGSVLALDAATLEDRGVVAVGEGPAEVTFSPNGKYAFVANGASGSVTVIDVATKAVVKTIPVGAGPVGAWQASNGVAYVDNEEAKTLTAIDTATLAVKLTYDLGFTPAYVALAPDGMLWVTDTDHGKVVINMPDMDMVHGEIETGAGAHAIAFAGTKTGYISNQEAGTVSVIDVATSRVIETIPVGSKPNGMVWRAK